MNSNLEFVAATDDKQAMFPELAFSKGDKIQILCDDQHIFKTNPYTDADRYATESWLANLEKYRTDTDEWFVGYNHTTKNSMIPLPFFLIPFLFFLSFSILVFPYLFEY